MFVAHGLWRVYVETPTIYMGLSGAFNREGMLDLQTDLLSTVEQHTSGSLHSVVVDLSEFEMSTADSFDVVYSYLEEVKQRDYKRINYVGANSLARDLLMKFWSRESTEVSFFDSVADFLEDQPHHQDGMSALVQIGFEHPH